MDLRISFEPWLPEALRTLKLLSRMGYLIPDRDIEALIESATIVDAGEDDPAFDDQ